MRLFLVVLLAFVFFAADASATSSSRYCVASAEAKMLVAINEYRAENELKSLVASPTLGAAAEHHSRDMARYDEFSHTLHGGISWSKNLDSHGYAYTAYRGENLAAGQSSATATLRQWKASRPHNALLLDPKMKAIGIGRAYDADARYTWYWTADFGGRIDSTAKFC